MEETKKCPRAGCPAKGKPQPLSAFQRNRSRPDGLDQYCRICRNDFMREGEAKRRARGVVRARVPEGAKGTVEQLQIARLRLEKSRLEGQVRELEKLALTGESVREILGALDLPNVQADPEWLRGASRQRSTHGTGVLFLSDIHWDEVVRKEQVGGSNAYNHEIAVARLQNTFKSGITLLKGCMSRPKYDGLVLPLGGDLLSGNIHEELTETNEFPIQLSMISIEETLAEGIGAMADEFGKVHVPCVTGNHGRMHKKPRAKNRAWENYEWSVYQRLAKHFAKDSRVTFDIPEGSDAYFNIYKTRFCLSHGDQFRGGDGIGGIMVPILRGRAKKLERQQAIQDPFDVMMIGHWHQYIHTNRLIINGSVKGYDEYAYQNNFPYEDPQQALFIVHPEVGTTFRMPVQCRYEGGRLNRRAA